MENAANANKRKIKKDSVSAMWWAIQFASAANSFGSMKFEDISRQYYNLYMSKAFLLRYSRAQNASN